MARSSGNGVAVIATLATLGAAFLLYQKGAFNSIIYAIAKKNPNFGMTPTQPGDTATYGPPMANGQMYDGGSGQDEAADPSMGADNGGNTGTQDYPEPFGPPYVPFADKAPDGWTGPVQVLNNEAMGAMPPGLPIPEGLQ